ncbi:MAG TPA: RNase H-like domain-containing protein, partial [Methylomirabilota bacterium]|nr:RNase H-like domain-containing protein [Methylomirabilota bacterium]
MNEHTIHVRETIDRLTSVNLILNADKCHFAQRCVYLLGFCISDKGISLDKRKLTNVVDWPVPTTGHAIQRFLGLINYFREHIPMIAKLTAPLDALHNQKNLGKLWTPKHDEHFQMLKSALLTNVLLKYPDVNQPFYIATDASNTGIGATLFQRHPVTGHKQYIGFMARSLSPSERNYSTTKWELLAVIFALKKFHQFLWGNPFTLYTDHKALTYLHTQKIANAMMITWLDTLLSYTFTVVHLPGHKNVLPDTLSRLFERQKELEGGKTAYKPSAEWKQAINKPERNTLEYESKQKYHRVFHVTKSTTPTIEKMCPPENERQTILQNTHLFGHFGGESMVKTIQSNGMYWPYMLNDAVDFVKTCTECQRHNIVKKGYHPLRPIHAYLPGDHWAIDLAFPGVTTARGNHYLLIMIDICTRFCILRAIPDKKSDTLIHTLVQVFCDFGFPRILQSDNGTKFKNSFMKKLAKATRIDCRLTTPYHPRANGVAERWVQSSVQALRKAKEAGEDWDLYVPSVQLALNNKVSKRLNTPPFSLMFARKMNGFIDYRGEEAQPMSQEELLKRIDHMADVVFPAIKEKNELAANAQKRIFDDKHVLIDIPDGSHVMVRLATRASKLAPAYEGPYTVIRRTQGGSYILQDETGMFMSRDYVPSELKLISQDDIVSKDDLYEVEAILAHRGPKGRQQYLVKWKGYGSEENSWIKPKAFT